MLHKYNVSVHVMKAYGWGEVQIQPVIVARWRQVAILRPALQYPSLFGMKSRLDAAEKRKISFLCVESNHDLLIAEPVA